MSEEMRARFMGSDEFGTNSSTFMDLKIISMLLTMYNEIYDCNLIPFSIFSNWIVYKIGPEGFFIFLLLLLFWEYQKELL